MYFDPVHGVLYIHAAGAGTKPEEKVKETSVRVTEPFWSMMM